MSYDNMDRPLEGFQTKVVENICKHPFKNVPGST